MIKDQSVRIFMTSMIATLYLLAFAAGLYIVEYNTRNVGFGDSVPILSYQTEDKRFEINALGKKLQFDLSKTDICFVGLNEILDFLQKIETNL